MQRTIGRKLPWPRRWRLRRLVKGMTLSCGCVAGVYETYAAGEAVTLIDVLGSSCAALGHDVNVLVNQGDTTPPAQAC